MDTKCNQWKYLSIAITLVILRAPTTAVDFRILSAPGTHKGVGIAVTTIIAVSLCACSERFSYFSSACQYISIGFQWIQGLGKHFRCLYPPL